MKKCVGLLFISLTLFACSAIKPLTLPPYPPPDFSNITRPAISPLIEGEDYTIDEQANKVTFTIGGLNKVTAKVISEQTAWQIIEMLKQTVQIQGEIIRQKDLLIINIDLQRQYMERGKTRAQIESYVVEIVGLILLALSLVK